MEERITKKSDLVNNDSISCFDNHCAQQNHFTYKVFWEFLNEIKPKRILEIGTALGGFTMFLKIVSDENNLNIDIRSYDVVNLPWYDHLKNVGIDHRVENVFMEDYNNTTEEVKDFIKSEGVTVILCDGGNKIKEFNLLSNFLKKGDFILAHDFSINSEVFKKEMFEKVWNWCEISEADISVSSNKNNLFFYNYDEFKKTAWVCKLKE